MDDTVARDVVTAFRDYLCDRVGRRDNAVWLLESSLPHPPQRVRMALEYAMASGLEGWEPVALTAMYLELARFVPEHQADLSPRRQERERARRRKAIERELRYLGSRLAGVGCPNPLPVREASERVPAWQLVPIGPGAKLATGT